MSIRTTRVLPRRGSRRCLSAWRKSPARPQLHHLRRYRHSGDQPRARLCQRAELRGRPIPFPPCGHGPAAACSAAKRAASRPDEIEACRGGAMWAELATRAMLRAMPVSGVTRHGGWFGALLAAPADVVGRHRGGHGAVPRPLPAGGSAAADPDMRRRCASHLSLRPARISPRPSLSAGRANYPQPAYPQNGETGRNRSGNRPESGVRTLTQSQG